MPVGKGGIHAMSGGHQAVVGDEVRGREAELFTPALVALDDGSLVHERGPKTAHRRVHFTRGDQRPDPARGNGLAVHLDKGDDASLELIPLGEHLGRALRLRAETEVLAHRDLLGAEPADQDPGDELLRRDLHELLVEVDDDELIHPQTVDHVLVPFVDTVEDADRDMPIARLGVGELCDLDSHARTTSGRRFSPSTRATAISLPSWVSRTWLGWTSKGSVTGRPCPTATASSASSGRSGMNDTSSSTETSRGLSSGTSRSPIAVRRSDSQ